MARITFTAIMTPEAIRAAVKAGTSPAVERVDADGQLAGYVYKTWDTRGYYFRAVGDDMRGEEWERIEDCRATLTDHPQQ
jgi:hypothetical protein